MEKQLSIPPVTMPEQIPQPLPAPRFQLGQAVRWACVPTSDFGRVVGVVFGSEGSVRELGERKKVGDRNEKLTGTHAVQTSIGLKKNYIAIKL